MRLPWRELPWSIAFWVSYVLVVSLEIRWMLRGRAGATSTVRDQGSNFSIMGIMFIAVALAFWYADRNHALEFTWHPHAWFVAGLVLMAAGASVRQWTMSVPGNHCASTVTGQGNHDLIEQGLYRLVRHPSHAGALLLWLGLGLALTNGLSLVVLTLAAALTYGLRIRAEEAALTEALGDRYRAYCARTWRLIPWIF